MMQELDHKIRANAGLIKTLCWKVQGIRTATIVDVDLPQQKLWLRKGRHVPFFVFL